jgi:serine/threonine protein kinase
MLEEEKQKRMKADQSATCIVHLAVDHGDGKREVALKLMKHKEQFDREIEVRATGQFSDQFVTGVIRSHNGEADEELAAELQRKGFQDTPYCIVMDTGSRSLADVIAKEHISGDWDKIRSLSAHIARALNQMHDKGLIHGDVKVSADCK